MGLRIVTWNVNGIRNPFGYQPWRDKRTFRAMFDLLEADIIVLQETKIQRKDLKDDMVLVEGWDCFFSFPRYEKGKFGVVIYTRQASCGPTKAEEGLTGLLTIKGKFGVVIYTRQASCGPTKAEEGLTGTLCSPNSTTCFRDLPVGQQIGGYPTTEQANDAPGAPHGQDDQVHADDFAVLDCEGRCVILEFPAFVLLGLYNPATRDESRVAFRKAFWNLLDIRIRNLVAMGKRVIVTGDLNVAGLEIDIANCAADLRKQGRLAEEYFSQSPRRIFNQLLDNCGVCEDRDDGREKPVLHDICRSFHPGRLGMYTHWETKINARPGNYGSRIDYILCSLDMKDWFESSEIQEGLMGSDHCPVYAVVKDMVEIDGQPIHIRDAVNPPGVYEHGRSKRELSQKDMLPLSGKLIPEFAGRRSIKDMFARKPSAQSASSADPSNQNVSNAERRSPVSKRSLSIDHQASEPAAPPEATRTDQCKAADAPQSQEDLDFALARKRSLHDASPKQSLKRAKSNTASPAAALSKNQKSLKGFFKAKAQPPPAIAESPNVPTSSPGLGTDVRATEAVETNAAFEPPTARPLLPGESGTLTSQDDEPQSPSEGSEVYDPIVSKESWSRLFTKPTAPLCEGHQEPCKVMTTKKKGSNFGRSFWMCSKPLGPSGQKENGTEWRCPTFIWCSERRTHAES